MNNHTIYTGGYTADFIDALEKVFTRLGWMPERDSSEILITVSDEDEALFSILSYCDWF